MDLLFTINTANRVIDIDTTGDAVLSFEALGNIASGNLKFAVSSDGVNFSPVNFFSFVSSTLKPEVSLATGFTGEERGSIDVLNSVKARVTSSADFQGNLRLSVCEVVDAPAPPSDKCCPSPTVFKTISLREGTHPVWVPTPGSRFVLMSYMIGVTGDATLAAAGLDEIRLLDGANPIGTDHWAFIPAAGGPTPAEPLYTSPWISLGDGYHSAAPNNTLNAQVSIPLTAGLVFVIVAGREE